MREILFRGKDDNNNWCYGYAIIGKRFKWASILPIDTIDDAPPMFDECEVELDTVGQYTGLTDKNGTKIFEGDIVGCFCNTQIFQVKWCDVRGGYFLDDVVMCGGSEPAPECLGNLVDTLEVIGNIYDNPELLEK